MAAATARRVARGVPLARRPRAAQREAKSVEQGGEEAPQFGTACARVLDRRLGPGTDQGHHAALVGAQTIEGRRRCLAAHQRGGGK